MRNRNGEPEAISFLDRCHSQRLCKDVNRVSNHLYLFAFPDL